MEPYINSILNVAQKVPTKEISGLTTGMVVHSKVGPIGQTKITSPRQFLDAYTVNGSISKGDHSSMHNAYFLSRFTDLVLVRATNSTIIPLTGMETAVDSVMLPNNYYADTTELIVPTLPNSSGDYRSLWLQIDNVLFYGSDGVNPFEDGDGLPNGTATSRVKGTEADQLEFEGLGVQADWDTVQLSVPLTYLNESDATIIEFNTDAYQEIANHFKRGGDVERGNIHVEVTDADTFKVYYNSTYPVVSTDFDTIDRDGIDENDPNDNPVHNLSESGGLTVLDLSSEPYLIGSTNVGSVNTLSAWVTDAVQGTDGYFYWTINLSDAIRGELSYSMSDNPDATDTQGNPIYWTTLSETREDIVYVKNVNSTQDVVNTVEPGAYNVGKSEDFILSTEDTSNLLSSAIYAANTFIDYDESRIQLYTDAGWYNAAIGRAFQDLSSATKSLTCIGIDPSVVDENVIIDYAANYTGYYSIVHANGGKDTSVVGFQLPISPSCYYIETLARNNTRNNSYAPVFSKVNGPISESNLIKNYSKTVRDKLNNARVNVLVYDDTDGVAYINNNLLRDSSGSLIDEDQSIRIVNDIQYDIDKLMENFYSRFNVDVTRALVESSIKNYFDTVILPQNYTIAGYKVDCSADNNSDINIQNNELKVDVYIQLNHSIKYITVTTNVVPTI